MNPPSFSVTFNRNPIKQRKKTKRKINEDKEEVYLMWMR